MLVPMPWHGVPSQCHFTEISWMQGLPDSVYLKLWQRWPQDDLPPDYQAYVVSFHLEAVDVDWVDHQAQNLAVPVIVLHDGTYYDWPHAKNVYPISYYYYQSQIDKIQRWHGKCLQNNLSPSYLASAHCSRITQSKLLIFTAIAEHIDASLTRLTLSDWLEPKNVHHFEPCGNAELDRLAEIFFDKYFGKIISHDNFDRTLNFQQHTSNYHLPDYNDTALHFTNESYHYSLMGDHIRPGPFITEKTLKCLVAGQAFVPVGQFDIYGHLQSLGFEFAYEFDTSWDQDPGNISRLNSIVNLIKDLSKWSIADVIEATKKSSKHNLEYVNSGDFHARCDDINHHSINQIHGILNC